MQTTQPVTNQHANQELRRRSSETFAWALVLSVVAHFLFFAYTPGFQTADFGFGSSEMTAIDLPPPEIDIPPPPEQIARPATPVVSAAQIDDQVTIASTTFESNPVEALPPPPTSVAAKSKEVRDAPTFTPMTVPPELINTDEVQAALVKQYPPMLKEAGITGTVVVWFFLDKKGHVVKTQVSQSSGFPAFDEVALRVSEIARFSPAKNRDQIVEVWVQIPIAFTVR